MLKTWVVVAESSRAKIYAMNSPRVPLVELEDLVHPEGRLHGRNLTSSRPGRAFDSAGEGRHAMEANVDPKQQEAINFAKRIGERLEGARTQGDFERLILVAPPAFLGLLRKNLSGLTMRRVTKEIAKNLVRADEAAIRNHLTER
ncbi:MAG: host attachment protein [Gammaproteobacteria bacterium]|nr:host attachment protein [Gammaproteobacteria bacterium]